MNMLADVVSEIDGNRWIRCSITPNGVFRFSSIAATTTSVRPAAFHSDQPGTLSWGTSRWKIVNGAGRPSAADFTQHDMGGRATLQAPLMAVFHFTAGSVRISPSIQSTASQLNLSTPPPRID